MRSIWDLVTRTVEEGRQRQIYFVTTKDSVKQPKLSLQRRGFKYIFFQEFRDS